MNELSVVELRLNLLMSQRETVAAHAQLAQYQLRDLNTQIEKIQAELKVQQESEENKDIKEV